MGDFVVVGTVRNVHNLLSYGVVGKSVCRMWESCTLAFPCSVNGLFHDGIASYTHFHKSKLRRNPNFLQKRLQIRIFTAKKFGFYF